MGLNTKPVRLQTKIQGFDLRNRTLKQKFEVFMRDTRRELMEMAEVELVRSMRNTNSVATGKLLDSIYVRLLKGSSTRSFEFNLGFTSPASDYAFYANYGREAGSFPPANAIADWMEARGIPKEFLYLIRSKIGSEGTEPKYFVEKAAQAIERRKEAIVARNLERFKRSL